MFGVFKRALMSVLQGRGWIEMLFCVFVRLMR